MPTRNISLTAQQDAFVDEVVKTGRYQNASEAVRDALRGLQHKLKVDELKIEVLRAQVATGTNALDRGEFTEITDTDLDAYLDSLTTNQSR